MICSTALARHFSHGMRPVVPQIHLGLERDSTSFFSQSAGPPPSTGRDVRCLTYLKTH